MCDAYWVMKLGLYGVWTTYAAIGEENAADTAALVQDLGFGTFWLGGSPRLRSVRPLLTGADRIVVGTGIVNVWQYDPADLAAEYAELAPAFGERLLVGIGIGHPEATSDYRRPLSSMRAFLDGLDHAPAPLPRDHRCLAALRPRMLELAAERSLGAHTYFVPVDHTKAVREQLGPRPLIATELACVVDRDPTSAREKARTYARRYLALHNYTTNLLAFGFTEGDFADGGSDRLLEAIIPHGTPELIAAVAGDHVEAGADHVCLQPVGVTGVPRAEWRALAGALGLDPDRPTPR
jgi:probable F420-dependent oxidoreductase